MCGRCLGGETLFYWCRMHVSDERVTCKCLKLKTMFKNVAKSICMILTHYQILWLDRDLVDSRLQTRHSFLSFSFSTFLKIIISSKGFYFIAIICVMLKNVYAMKQEYFHCWCKEEKSC